MDRLGAGRCFAVGEPIFGQLKDLSARHTAISSLPEVDNVPDALAAAQENAEVNQCDLAFGSFWVLLLHLTSVAWDFETSK